MTAQGPEIFFFSKIASIEEMRRSLAVRGNPLDPMETAFVFGKPRHHLKPLRVKRGCFFFVSRFSLVLPSRLLVAVSSL